MKDIETKQTHTQGPWELNDLSIESVSEGKWIACTDSRGNDLCEDLANATVVRKAKGETA